MSGAGLDRVILVDEHDRAIGSAGKLEAHRLGLLHRAVSVFLFDERGRLLLQQRAEGKYHSAGLWSNTCCSHPRPGESTSDAARRRLREEMGIVAPLDPAFRFIYRAVLGNGLIEHELDHVFSGVSSATPVPEPAEVADWRWAEPSAVDAELTADASRFTAWFPLAWERIRT